MMNEDGSLSPEQTDSQQHFLSEAAMEQAFAGVEPLQDILACAAKYYDDLGYLGHNNCSDNFNAALARMDIHHAEIGTTVEIGKLDGQQKRFAATVVRFPHYDPEKSKPRS